MREVTIRSARFQDLARVNELAHETGMDRINQAENLFVACSTSGQIVGYVRLTYGGDPLVAHVNPIVVSESARREGIGKQLMEFVHELQPEVRLVARGEARPFYSSLGYQDIPWVLISNEVAAECKGCPDKKMCSPQPMGFVSKRWS